MDEIIIYVKPMLISGVIAVSAIAVAYVLIAFYLPHGTGLIIKRGR